MTGDDVWGARGMRSNGRIRSVAVAVLVAATIGAGISPVVAGRRRRPPPLTLQGRGSVDEAWLTGANPGDHITLMQHRTAVANDANPGTADSLGSLIIRNLTPGPGYRWVDTTTGQRTPSFSVLAPGRTPRPSRPSTPANPCTRG